MYTLMGGRHGIEFILRGLTAGAAEAKKLMLEGEGYAAVIIREVPHAGEQEYMTRATRVATGEEKKADRRRERDVSVAVLTVCAIGICVIVAAMWIGGML